MKIARKFQSILATAGIACSALTITSCASVPASAPTAQLAVSKAAVADAVSAGGSDTASLEMKSAQDKLDRANVAFTAKNYEQATALAEQAEVDAKLAETKARSAKAQKAADALQDDIRVLHEEINRKSK
ncbi:MAG: DUF4398 domain-containing protein [Pseudomonadota bacterium]